MARPKKIGLDYFPIDVTFDEKVQAIEMLHENDGLVWIIKFWQAAYKTELGEVDVQELFGELFAKNCRITTEKQSKIIVDCEKIGLIYKTEDGLLTSTGIKKRISAVSQEREDAIKRKKSKVKESKVKKTPHSSEDNTGSSENNSLFYQFWALYPKKVGKGAAEKVWDKIQKPKEVLNLIMTALVWQPLSRQWSRENGQFIPNPSTYLNQRRWEDEPEGKPKTTGRRNRTPEECATLSPEEYQDEIDFRDKTGKYAEAKHG